METGITAEADPGRSAEGLLQDIFRRQVAVETPELSKCNYTKNQLSISNGVKSS